MYRSWLKTRLKAGLLSVFFTVLTLLPLTAQSIPGSRIKGYPWLLSAIRNNHLPNGYLDLAKCRLTKNISDMKADRRTYGIKFTDNFSFNPDSGEIITIMNILYLQTKDLNGTPVLMNRPATTILSGKPKNDFLNYQIVMSFEGKTLMQLYQCPWDKAVFLWR